MAFIAGPYSYSYNGLDLGISEDGMDLDVSYFSEAIRGDNLGSATQDRVYRAGDVFISWTAQEWNAAGMALAYWPWATFGAPGVVGRLATSVSAALTITVYPGTPAAAVGPNTLTGLKSILASDFNTKHIFATRHRKMPLRHQFLPYNTGVSGDLTAIRWFTTT